MGNKILNLAIVVISTCIFLAFFLFTKGLSSLGHIIGTLSVDWAILSILCMGLFWVLETCVLYIVTRAFINTENSFIKSIKFEMMGQFFGTITPFASGSHPAQLYAMTENGIPGGVAGSILMVKFIIHQATNIIILALAFLFKFHYFNTKMNYFVYIFLLSMVVHVFIMFFAILFFVNKRMTKSILQFALKILYKLRIIKNHTATYEKVESELEAFHKNAGLLLKNMKMCLFASLLTVLQWIAFFSIPYCIYRSFGFASADYWVMLAGQIFLTNLMAIVPLPGAEGGAEGGFFLIYNSFFRDNTIMPAILIWRIITYYSSIVVGGIFTLIIPDKLKNKI